MITNANDRHMEILDLIAIVQIWPALVRPVMVCRLAENVDGHRSPQGM